MTAIGTSQEGPAILLLDSKFRPPRSTGNTAPAATAWRSGAVDLISGVKNRAVALIEMGVQIKFYPIHSVVHRADLV